MDLFTAIEQRRSVKHFIDQDAISDQDFETLMQAVLLSPTSYNIQHWRFVRVTDYELRRKIKAAAWGQEQVETAAELLIFCANVDAWQQQPERYWANADQDTQSMLVNMLGDFYRGQEQLQYDEGIRSSAMAAQTLMLSAKAMGYDTCPMIGFDTEKVAELINLPVGHIITMMIALGKADQPANPRGGQLSMDEVLISNQF